jgi:glutamate formiminotransferase/glutamate formiminotransferase/formiminotetrahydrofolate cyclodeaminase
VTLLAVPNASEGRDAQAIAAIGDAFGGRLLDVHSDPDHNRSVFTLAARQGEIAEAVLAGAREALAQVDLRTADGIHPHVGALDVAPVVFLDEARRGAACAEALVLAELLGTELHLPVFLYGLLAGGRSRADLRRGGTGELARRVEAGELRPDFGPARIDPAAGATLVAARPPLVAFNLELAPAASLDDARAIAAAIRSGGPVGLDGLRAIGLWLQQKGVAQVSCNIEDHRATPLAKVVAAVRERADVTAGELVGLAPRAAFDGFPDDLDLLGFDPARHLIENVLEVS